MIMIIGIELPDDMDVIVVIEVISIFLIFDFTSALAFPSYLYFCQVPFGLSYPRAC